MKYSILIFLLSIGLSVNAQQATIETYAKLDQAVGNIAFTKKGQLVFSHHPFFKPDIRVARYDKKTDKVIPFPNKDWNTPKSNSDHYLDDVLGIRNDKKGIIWMLDMGTRNDITPKLVGWNTKHNRLERIFYIPAPASLPTSQHNDFVIDTKHSAFIIADEGIARGGDGSKAALVIVDMKTGKTRRVLQNHFSTLPDYEHPIMIDGTPMSVGSGSDRHPIFVGADGITLDHKNDWLYYTPLSGTKIYRIKMTDLLNENLTEKQLTTKVETFSDKYNNGGLSIDKKGNLYLTNVESASIGIVTAEEKKLSVFAKEDKMLWPDGISYNKDGYMYVSAAQVHLGAPFNLGKDKTKAPFYVFRFKPLKKGIFGR